jgi:SAM-dependent methyltransferase
MFLKKLIGDHMPVSQNYSGQAGKEYFKNQYRGGVRQGEIEARKFKNSISKESCVLDFGCGSGSILYNIDCRERFGIEINPEARKEATSLGIAVYENLDDVPDCNFDVVISNHALEHVECPFHELEKIHRKLLPNGKFIIFVPIDDWRVQQKIDPEDKRHHLYTWTPQLFANLLSEAGFSIEKIWIYTHIWPSSWRIFDRFLPIWLFDFVCTINAIIRKRRQMGAIAIKK